MINYDNRMEEKVMFKANENRYDNMIYRRCGKSGLKLSAVSLGLWKNFGVRMTSLTWKRWFIPLLISV